VFAVPERFAKSGVRIGMQYSELLARRIVMEVVRSTVDGGGLKPIILHEVARHLQIDGVSATAGLNRGIKEGWLIVEGYRIRLTEAGRALLPPR
jgi:Mn-dependent DtxR family transcriptional regulator